MARSGHWLGSVREWDEAQATIVDDGMPIQAVLDGYGADDGIPITVDTDEPTTVPRCAECVQRCIVGGPIAPGIDAMAHASPYECARGSDDDGNAWLWCVGQPGAWRLVRYRRR